jgi:hypothetical protein
MRQRYPASASSEDQGCDGGARVLGHLPPCEAHDAVAEGRQHRVAAAVVLEGGRREVGAGAVGLDDEAVLRPQEVDLVRVRPWHWSVEEAEVFRSVNDAFEAVRAEGGREVDEGAGDRSDGQTSFR